MRKKEKKMASSSICAFAILETCVFSTLLRLKVGMCVCARARERERSSNIFSFTTQRACVLSALPKLEVYVCARAKERERVASYSIFSFTTLKNVRLVGAVVTKGMCVRVRAKDLVPSCHVYICIYIERERENMYS